MNEHQPRLHRRIDRPPADLVRRFAALDVATVYESSPVGGVMWPEIAAVQNGLVVCGPAVTAANVAGDNLAMHVALDLCQAGDVLVVAAGSPTPAATWGALAAAAGAARSLQGFVTDGFVRDVSSLRAGGVGVWARGISPLRAAKERIGGVNVPVVCGGVEVYPGDIVLADDDGVVVVPASLAESVLMAAEGRAGIESAVRAELAGGRSTFDVFEMSKLIDGVVEVVETPWSGFGVGRHP